MILPSEPSCDYYGVRFCVRDVASISVGFGGVGTVSCGDVHGVRVVMLVSGATSPFPLILLVMDDWEESRL